MFWWWSPDWGWVGGLIAALFWIGLIALAVILLRQELPNLEARFGGSTALRILEERYARGEISREEFLERRAVLLGWSDLGTTPEESPGGPDTAEPPEPGEPTEPLAP